MVQDTLLPAGFSCLIKPFLSPSTARNVAEMARIPATNKIGGGEGVKNDLVLMSPALEDTTLCPSELLREKQANQI